MTLGKTSYSTWICAAASSARCDVRGGHGRDGVALVKDLAHRQAVRGQVSEVHGARFAHDRDFVFPGRGNPPR